MHRLLYMIRHGGLVPLSCMWIFNFFQNYLLQKFPFLSVSSIASIKIWLAAKQSFFLLSSPFIRFCQFHAKILLKKEVISWKNNHQPVSLRSHCILILALSQTECLEKSLKIHYTFHMIFYRLQKALKKLEMCKNNVSI